MHAPKTKFKFKDLENWSTPTSRFRLEGHRGVYNITYGNIKRVKSMNNVLYLNLHDSSVKLKFKGVEFESYVQI